MQDESAILITGANGQLGTALRQKFAQARAADKSALDIANADAVSNYDWSGIKTVINAAAYTNVDGAETPEGRVSAWQINAVGTANLARAALEHDLTLVHVSSEYVFDGSRNPHTEDEAPSPLSSYGASKAAGDTVISLVPKHYIIRTSWLVGEGNNFVRTMLDLGRKGVAPTVVSDQVGRLTFADELTRAIEHLLNNSSPHGTYNVSSGGQPASWADITRAIFKNAAYNLEVTDTTTEAYYANKPESARRPLNSVFDLSKIEATGFKPTDWREDLKKYIENEMSK